MQIKIWVRRPGASPTIVKVHEDDLVDNVRDVILHKYSNSLGKCIDSPDITLKIISREQTNKAVSNERPLGPEESIRRTLDAYYPGGQTVDEALIIEVPQRRTPRPSPRVGNHQLPYYIAEEYQPGDGAREYFPPMAPLQSPHLSGHQHSTSHPSVHSMSVLATGQLPPLPSPGVHSSRRRPKFVRQHTSSPTILHSTQSNSSVIGALE
jgi:osomolarity two-component system, response regulator SSK1